MNVLLEIKFTFVYASTKCTDGRIILFIENLFYLLIWRKWRELRHASGQEMRELPRESNFRSQSETADSNFSIFSHTAKYFSQTLIKPEIRAQVWVNYRYLKNKMFSFPPPPLTAVWILNAQKPFNVGYNPYPMTKWWFPFIIII